MPDPRWSDRQHRIGNDTLARAVGRVGGDRLVASMRAVLGEGPAMGGPAFAVIEDTRATVRNALETGSREAARLLVEGARSALQCDEEYASQVDCSNSQPTSLDAVGERARQLALRVSGTSGEVRDSASWPSLPTPQTAESGREMAAACVSLAMAIRPDWEWATLQRAHVMRAEERYAEAMSLFAQVSVVSMDFEARVSALRNQCACLTQLEQPDAMASALGRLVDLVGAEDVRVSYLALELAAVKRDRVGAEPACRRLAESLGREPDAYWARLLIKHSDHFSSRLGASFEELRAWAVEFGR